MNVIRLSALLLSLHGCLRADAGRDWAGYLGGEDRSNFSTLAEITTENVHRLNVAWTYRSGEFKPDMRKQIQCNPLVIDGVLYGTTALQKLVAVDAATGRERWRFDPHTEGRSKMGDVRHRGLACWTNGRDRRLILAHDRYLYALNLETGKLVRAFGDQGMIDFKDGLATDEMVLNSGTPGVVFGNLYILPTRTSESHGSAAPGHIRAFDLETGRLVWTFHTIPQPGEYGYETWPPDAWKSFGGANCWAGMTLDKERGLVFVPTGSAAYDFWGGNRRGENLFSNSLICLDARTGKRVWHYQIVRHDIWDRDLPAPPNLVTVRRDGRDIPAVTQTTKSGHVFVFNRETGEPLFPIDERPAPASDIPGEFTWPTQPLPRLPAPFSRQTLAYDDLTTLTPEAHRAVVDRFARLRQHAPTGTPNYGGPVATAGGLVFIASTPDEMIRAFDRKTGRILWQSKLPAAGYATPATYVAGDRQHLVVACGGGKLGTKSDDVYVAFALPQ
ncbi:MAG: PQQ-binding-like beta-propeller repeat protein [Verrucomicrobia bacterium]|nr:PQQ-binding-like beta-propeller repeat protein [Verrucomicrobiota bacterium]